MADIFISYSQKDRALAKSLADALKACGYDVWWDYEVSVVECFETVCGVTERRASAHLG